MLMPLAALKTWGPFRLDALGLVTLLGADEVARAVGTLSPNGLTDFMPLLGGYRIAGNQFVTVEPGYTMYNVSDGITNTEFSAWFTRWLSQYVDGHAALELKLRGRRPGLNGRVVLSVVLGTLAHMSMVIFAAVQADWWGVANAAALFVATCVRNYLIEANRNLYDKKIINAIEKVEANGTTAKVIEKPRLKRVEKKKVLIVRPDGTLVVMYIPLGMLLTLFGKLDPSPTKFFSRGWHGMYTVARGVGWLAFGVHIITIGQAYLTSQILAVGIMAISTILTIFNIGTQEGPDLLNPFKRRWHRKNDAESGNANIQPRLPDALQYDLGRYLTINVLTVGEKPPPAAVPQDRNTAAKAHKAPTNGTPPANVSPKPVGNPQAQREVNRREWYAFLAPSQQQQQWMREWHLIALKPNDRWYNDWYNFLRGWKADRKNENMYNGWDRVFEFLGMKDEGHTVLDSIWLGPDATEANKVDTANKSVVLGPRQVQGSTHNQDSIQIVAGANQGDSST